MATAVRVDNHGEVFTRGWVVDTILDLVGYTADRRLDEVTVVEPSCGSGAFLGPIIDRLLVSAGGSGVDFVALSDCVAAFDIQGEHVEAGRRLVVERLRRVGCELEVAEKLARGWVRRADYLLDDTDVDADFVVGNPPYIRIEDLPSLVAALYRGRWSTMNGRADIYVPFIERSLKSLKPGGRLGFICADRWFRNSYGSKLRELVAESFAMEHAWTMHDVDAFANDVSSYPAITVIGNTEQGPVTVLDTTAQFGAEEAAAATRWALSGALSVEGYGYRGHRLPDWFSGKGFWPTGSPARLALIEHLCGTYRTLADEATGTRVGIGVATGADKVYILGDPETVEPERALPMVAGKDLNSGTFEWGGEYLANVWSPDGSLVDLADYPKLASHLGQFDDQLKRRHTAKKNPVNWYRTIDKVNHSLLERPLLMMRDLGKSANPVLVPPGYYPHHNVYWISSDTWDLEVLGGFLLSRVAQAVIEAFCVRMRGGTLRFQAQYLRQIRVPDPHSILGDHQAALRQAFRDRDTDLATTTACKIMNINQQDYEL